MSEAKQSHWQEGGNAVRRGGDERRWRTVQKKSHQISRLSANSPNRTERWEMFAWNLTPPPHHRKHIPHTSKKTGKKKKKRTFQITLSFKDNSQHVQRGRALACLWKSHQIWYRIDNRTYNHKSIMHTKVAYNVWQHSTIHCTRGSLSDNEIQNSG